MSSLLESSIVRGEEYEIPRRVRALRRCSFSKVNGKGESLLSVPSTRGAVIISALIVFCDQITKTVVRKTMPVHESISVLPFFSLTHIENSGAAFGIARGVTGGNIILMVVTGMVLIFLYRERAFFLSMGKWGPWGLGLVSGGALGNLADRIVYQRVTDFLDFYWKNFHWPAFNVADSAITVGAVLLGIASFRRNTTEMNHRDHRDGE